MRQILGGIVGVALMLLTTNGFAKCGDAPGDTQAVADARAQVETDCPCASALTHGDYVSCAAGVANDRAKADPQLLPNNCKGAVVKCAARSTCGKAGFVTCCRLSGSGKLKCSTKSDCSKCNAPNGGEACCGTQSSCCDACDANSSPPCTP